MIRTLQKKFVFTAMIAITILLVVMLGAINIFNAWSIVKQTDRRIEALAFTDAAQQPMMMGDKSPRDFFVPDMTENDRMASVFFSVILSEKTGRAMIMLNQTADVDEADAVELTEQAIQSKRTTGTIGHYKYLISAIPYSSEIKIIFLDVSNDFANVLRVLILSGLIGAVSWGIMLGVVILLSKKAICPIAENIENQKRFVTDAGHEIKTPLAIILANTEAMELYQGESKWSKNIKSQIIRLNGLMQSLLNFEKIEANAETAPKNNIDLSGLLTETLEIFDEPMMLKNLSVEKQIEENIQIFAQTEQIRQLLSILTDNAVKYASPESQIMVELKREKQSILLQMSNDCDSLPDCPPEKLFERFYRGDTARTQKNGGYGIGLSAAKTIVENIGGKIEAVYDAEHRIRFVCILKNM